MMCAVGRRTLTQGVRAHGDADKEDLQAVQAPDGNGDNLAPNGSNPGLVTWYCEYCGAADSDLIYPTLSERLA